MPIPTAPAPFTGNGASAIKDWIINALYPWILALTDYLADLELTPGPAGPPGPVGPPGPIATEIAISNIESTRLPSMLKIYDVSDNNRPHLVRVEHIVSVSRHGKRTNAPAMIKLADGTQMLIRSPFFELEALLQAAGHIMTEYK